MDVCVNYVIETFCSCFRSALHLKTMLLCAQAGVLSLQRVAFAIACLSFFVVFLFAFCSFVGVNPKPMCVCLSNLIFDYINLLMLRAQTYAHHVNYSMPCMASNF